MKYLITMKNGTTYLDEQHSGFIEQMSAMMAEQEFTPVHQGSDGTFVIRCSEVAAVDRLTEAEAEQCH
ncbi:MAG: hypothetical protein CMP20_12245 [Rickettsiales bacterium]|jgi:hypothetical protein|nr:hypothetical protein [Rickettsiales bacterium]